MKKWVTNIIEAPSVDAVSKSRNDITTIGRQAGYEQLYIYRYIDESESDEALNARIDGITAAVTRDDFVIYQYPCYNGSKYEESFVRRLKLRGIKVAILIHDSELIRGSGYNDEKRLLELPDALIVHGEPMENRLREFGIQTPMIRKELFDFLVTSIHGRLVDELERKLVFAGNIAKSRYLKDWNFNTEITAFGRKGEVELSEKVDYQGEFQQEDLIRVIPKNAFGLAWDNDIKDGGAYGQYTRYNAPHKVSMYLALGMPVIVWKESAAAQLIQKYQLGYAIDSLDDLDKLMMTISDEDLVSLKQRVNHFSNVLRDGRFTKNAMNDFSNLMLFPKIEEVMN
ncbi:sugar transferase [Enterococcus sp. AZ103]|uniref:sugar transferase n=1 Tax=Enterococcus sp. AZ103 TaxID=2774628 RepID=UPI003F26C3D3